MTVIHCIVGRIYVGSEQWVTITHLEGRRKKSLEIESINVIKIYPFPLSASMARQFYLWEPLQTVSVSLT